LAKKYGRELVNANVARLLVVVFVAWGSIASCRDAIRIDGSSDAAADRSFQRMMESLKPDEQEMLSVALVQINLGDAQSVYDMLRDPNKQHPSAAHVRDKIAGMTASEIIDFARKTSTTKVIVKGQEPGIPQDLLRPLVGGQPPISLAETVWVIEANVNGNTKQDVYALHADHSMTLIESEKTQGGTARWQQAGEEVRLSMSDGFSVYLGHVVDATTIKGDGGNKNGFRWTWTATKR
jgi:hypothetical protein